MADSIHEFEVETISGEKQSLGEYEGKVLLIVNTASKCGFTPQYEGLEALHEKYKDQGFEVLGFPCNQFGAQEPGDNSEISEFCELNFGVTFPLFSKIDVNGDEAHPLYEYLKSAVPGLLGSRAIKWNFTKFLVGRDGKPVERFSPQTKPEALDRIIKAKLAES
ncbi:MAG: glutathione peroxidase [Xanthomonadales bacterium]|nr:glutathione peroxidase [Xanthomonadales bacterium]